MAVRLLGVSIVCSVLITVGRAADFESGLRALDRGDYAAALKEFAPLAERGDDLAQYNLAVMYYRGDGVDQNYKEAERLFRLSAKQGYAQAQYFLGYMISEGKGVHADKPEAAKWFRLAAEQGVPLAEFRLAAMYMTGNGTPQDDKEFVYWLKRAAEHGVPFAQFNLGFMYEVGDGVLQDSIQAYKWFFLCIDGERSCVKGIDQVAKEMTQEQINEARRLAKEWKSARQKADGVIEIRKLQD
jgi:uncharacterized protein